MGFALRPVTTADLPALQGVYDACRAAFVTLIGQPAAADQAEIDFAQAQVTSGRFLFAVMVDDEMIGLADCKLDDELKGAAYLGLLLLAPPYDDPAIASLVLRILTRWLTGRLGVLRLGTDVAAHNSDAIRFWTSEGFQFTGEQYRRDLLGFSPRFLVMIKDLDTSQSPLAD